MKGTNKAGEILKKYKDRPILVYFDPDVDGLLSGYIACQYLEKQGLTYQYYLNKKREHGFKLPISAVKGYLILAVDFDIDRATMQALVDNDCSIASFDHHEIGSEFIEVHSDTAEGVIVNNQYTFEEDENRYNSGAGVTYEGLCEIDPTFASKELEAVVGITLLSDARPIENDRARKYLTTTFKQDCSKGYFNYLIQSVNVKDYGIGVPRMDRNFIDFTFSPLINSLLRFGKETEALDFILGKGLRVSDTKDRQKALVKRMNDNANVLRMSSLIVVAIHAEDFPDIQIEPFIGLLCSQVKNLGTSAIAFVVDNGTVTRASFRGKYDDIHYDIGFKNMGIDARGHKNAFGILNFKPTAQTWQELNDLIEQLDEGHQVSANIIQTANIATVLNNKGYAIATENCYVRDQYRTYLRYSGKNIVEGVKTSKYLEYIVDGRRIKCFDADLKVSEGLILPMLEKGHIQLYLKPEVE